MWKYMNNYVFLIQWVCHKLCWNTCVETQFEKLKTSLKIWRTSENLEANRDRKLKSKMTPKSKSWGLGVLDVGLGVVVKAQMCKMDMKEWSKYFLSQSQQKKLSMTKKLDFRFWYIFFNVRDFSRFSNFEILFSKCSICWRFWDFFCFQNFIYFSDFQIFFKQK